MKKPFSKKLLIFDYVIMGILLIVLIGCALINGAYTANLTQQLIESGMDAYSVTAPIDLSTLSVLASVWATQLGISSGAYYILIRSEHKIQMPMKLIEELPDDIKQNVDMTTIITTVLSTVGN